MVPPVAPQQYLDLQSAIIPDPLVVAPDLTLSQAVEILAQAQKAAEHNLPTAVLASPLPPAEHDSLHHRGRFSGLVVVEAERVVGLLTNVDIVRWCGQPNMLASRSVGEVMRSPPPTLKTTDLPSKTNWAHLLRQVQRSPVVVVDPGGQLVGLLTPETVLSLTGLEPLQPYPATLSDRGGRADLSHESALGEGFNPSTAGSAEAGLDCGLGFAAPTKRRQGPQKSGRMLHDIISSTKACITQFRVFPNKTWEYVFFSEGSELVFGYSPGELLDRPGLWSSLVYPDDFKKVVMPAIEAVLQGQPHLDLELRCRHRNGDLRWVGESCTARWQEEQHCWVVTGVAIDITERKQLEAQLRQSEAELLALFDAMDDIVLVLDQQGYYLKVVSTKGDSLYRPAPELLGKTLAEVFSADQADHFLTIIQTVIETQTSQEVEYFLMIDGERRWFSARCSPISAERVIWVARDITERVALETEWRRNEQSLRQSEAKRRAILTAMPDLMFRLGADGRYREVISPRPDLEMFFKGRNPVGRKLADLVPAEIATHKLAVKDQALATGELQVYEQQMETDSGLRFEEVRVIKSGEDEVLFMIRDITERKQAERTLRQQLAAIEAAVDGIGILQEDTYLYLNQSHVALFGYDNPQDLIGKTWREFYSPEEIQRFEQEVFPLLRRDRVWQGEATALRRDGTTFSEGLSLTLTEDNILICVCRDISELKQAQAQIIHNSLHDPLTGLPNRALLEDRLTLALQRAKTFQDYRYAVLFIDLDRFKVVNDSLGHLIGDQLLVAVAQRLQAQIRSTDLAARLGGDEFVLLLEDIDNTDTVTQIAERILAESQHPLMLDGHEVFTGMSIGIVFGNSHYEAATDLIRDADLAMYKAKQNRQASYQFFGSSMHSEMLERHTLEMELHRALEQGELVVHYQPIFNLTNAQLVGFEALVRWCHPSRGLVYPDVFLPCAEDSGLIVPIDRWVLHQAGQHLWRWQSQRGQPEPLRMHVNLSAQNFTADSLLDTIDRVMNTVALPYPWLTVEITEKVLIEDIATATELLNQLADRQIQTSIDDFGIGYSSLQYLHRLPLNSLKIDRSFVGQIDTSDRDYQLVKTMVNLGQQLNLSIIAEGIENRQQLQLIQRLNCQLGQGYFFSQPLPADQIEARVL